jgi:hypothetical protein
MKLDQLRSIIREEVRSAVKEELQEVMNEAVKAASAPNILAAPAKTIQVEKQVPTSTNPLMEMLEQTKASMSPSEYKSIYAGTADMVQKPNFASSMANQMGMTNPSANAPGMDISQLDFIKKAGKVYKRSVEKDKEKHGIV